MVKDPDCVLISICPIFSVSMKRMSLPSALFVSGSRPVLVNPALRTPSGGDLGVRAHILQVFPEPVVHVVEPPVFDQQAVSAKPMTPREQHPARAETRRQPTSFTRAISVIHEKGTRNVSHRWLCISR